MATPQKTIAKIKKTADLSNLAFHKEGPKSFKKGLGALLIAVNNAGGTITQRELTDVLGMGRKGVKKIVMKGVRSDLLEIGESEEKKVYTISLTKEGKEVVAKRIASDTAVAEKMLAGLTDQEIEQLTAICDKIIVNIKDMGIKGKKKAAYSKRRRNRKGHKGCKGCKH